MDVCVARNGEMLFVFSFFPNNSLNGQLSFRIYVGFEPYGVISWPQAAPIAPTPPPPTPQLVVEPFPAQCTQVIFFLAFLHIFQNFPCTLGEKK